MESKKIQLPNKSLILSNAMFVINKTIMKHILLLSLLLIISVSNFAQVSINTDGSNPDNSAMLDIKSDTAGILIPRMTKLKRNAINTPANGLLIYQTDDTLGFYYYNGSTWKSIGGTNSNWELNNKKLSAADTSYKVSIGTSNPTGTFEVATLQALGTYGSDVSNNGTATASSTYTTYTANRAFDNDNSTQWLNNAILPSWIQYDLGSGNEKRVAKYRIYFSDPSSFDHAPSSWTFQASTNGSTWITLDTRTGQSWTYNSWKEFTFSNNTPYQYYRINISDNQGSSDNYVQINETEMMEEDLNNYTTLFVDNTKVGIGTNSPQEALEINGHLRMTDGNQAAGNILISDASGSASWANADTLGVSGWKVSGDTVYNLNSRIGIGTSNPYAKMEIQDTLANITLYIQNSNNTNHFQYGNRIKVSGSGSGFHFGTFHYLTGTGNGIHFGVKNYFTGAGNGNQVGNCSEIFNTGSGKHFGTENYLDGSGSGNKYGTYNVIATFAGGTHYGVYSKAEGTANYAGYFKGNMYVQDKVGIGIETPIAKMEIQDTLADTTLFIQNSNNTNSDQYGNIIKVSGSGSGTHYGAYHYITGSGAGQQYGVMASIDNSGNQQHSGYYSHLEGSGSGFHFGMLNELYGSGGGKQYGVKNKIYNSGNGMHYGVETTLSGAGNGNQFGNISQIYNTGSGAHFGTMNYLNGSGSGDKYGTSNYIATAAGGTHYGVYSEAEGTANYAGYFKGNMYVQDKVGIGIETPIAKMEIQDTLADTTLFIQNSNNTNSNQYGNIIKVSGSGSGTHYGAYHYITGSGAGQQYGVMASIDNSANQRQYGYYSHLEGSGSGYHFGMVNELFGSGGGNQFGVVNNLTNSGNGTHFGVKTFMSGTGTGPHYGTWNYLYSSGTGNKYGTYDTIPTSASGTHYGVYSVAEGSSNYAGYFKGNVNVSEKIKAPASGDADLKPYIYGSLSSTTGAAYSNESTTGFTATLESTGVYKITFSNYNSDKNYLVIANALRTTSPIILTYEKNNGYFRIRAWDLSGNLVNAYLNFVVYKK